MTVKGQIRTVRVPAERGVFLTLGIPAGERGRKQVKRALELLARNGFAAATTSDEAVLAAAQMVEQDEPERATHE